METKRIPLQEAWKIYTDAWAAFRPQFIEEIIAAFKALTHRFIRRTRFATAW